MLNSEELINKVKIYNKFLNPEKLNKAYDFAVKLTVIKKEHLVILTQYIQLKLQIFLQI